MQTSTLWIDITELFGEFQWSEHPTGISRVVLNFVDELRARPPAGFTRVEPLFWDPVTNRAVTLDDWSHLGALRQFFPGLRRSYQGEGLEQPFLRSGIKKGLLTSLPRSVRYRLFPHLAGVPQFLSWLRGRTPNARPVAFCARDALFVPGSFWLGGYIHHLADRAKAAGAPIMAFVHDVLLLSHPEWMPGGHSEQFRRGAEAFLPRCDRIICNSQNTLAELKTHIPLPPSIVFGVCRLADRLHAEPAQPRAIDLTARKFALIVSSVIPRKNHALAVRAWALLRREFGDRTPDLVLVGGGHPDPDLAEALDEAVRCGGGVLRLTGTTDEELVWLYQNAWLTLYPSLGEGYGLPVAEALAQGKACIASAAGGVAEIAPSLVDVVDLHDPRAMADVVGAYLNSPERLAVREAAIRQDYRGTEWQETAAQVSAFLGSIPPPSARPHR